MEELIMRIAKDMARSETNVKYLYNSLIKLTKVTANMNGKITYLFLSSSALWLLAAYYNKRIHKLEDALKVYLTEVEDKTEKG